MLTFSRPILIKNPTSGVWWARAPTRRVFHNLKEWLPSLEVVTTAGSGDAMKLAQDASRKGYDFIIAAGGDGTINEVINGITGTETVLAVLPAGTGNSIAYELDLPLHPVKAVEALRNGEVREAYLGIADGRYFALMVGVGFDGYAVQQVPYRLKRILGRMSYVVAGSIALLRYPYPSFTVVADGKPFIASTVIIAKSQYYASTFRIAPHVSLKVPGFELCAFTGHGPWRYLKYVGAVILNRHSRVSGVTLLKAHEVQIKAVPGLRAQMDGEVMPVLPTSIRMADMRIRVLFPKRAVC